jgi:APA family basic amino acid/polyamine antiporter
LSSEAPKPKPTLGLTGLTMNAMALIAPGAFLWLTFQQQCVYGAPMAGIAMWIGIVFALALCFATAISYAELSKLYPGAGSSYFFAEQAFLSKTHAYRFARIAKFVIGWSSHLYYWIYPGVMVGVTGILFGWLLGQVFPSTFSTAVGSPVAMMGFCILFAFGVAYIAYRGVNSATAVNIAINVIQISALLIFSVIAIGYRLNHTEGKPGLTLDANGTPTEYVIATEKDKDGKDVPIHKKDANGKDTDDWVFEKDEAGNDKKVIISYAEPFTQEPVDKDKPDGPKQEAFHYHDTALSVVSPHGFSFIIIQACIAILILVGFECVTSMGEEARNAKRDIPRAVLLSLLIQGVVCYLIEYFAANYFLNSGYDMPTAAASGAPIGDMMIIVGTWLFGSPQAGWWFMIIQAFTVFLALIGTTLSCMNTGARVTYAMGRDEEVPSHFGMLHGKNMTPHRAIWTLAGVSAVLGIITVSMYLGGSAASASMDTALTDAQKNSIWYPSFLTLSYNTAKDLPNSLVTMTLASNFGTFMLYMLTCIIAIVAFIEHHTFSGFKHLVVPIFGLLANLVCMLFYLIGPTDFVGIPGMTWKEPYIALGIAAVWGIWGAMYFIIFASHLKGRSTLVGADALNKKTAAPTF